jgi:hypothetical protein
VNATTKTLKKVTLTVTSATAMGPIQIGKTNGK